MLAQLGVIVLHVNMLVRVASCTCYTTLIMLPVYSHVHEQFLACAVFLSSCELMFITLVPIACWMLLRVFSSDCSCDQELMSLHWGQAHKHSAIPSSHS